MKIPVRAIVFLFRGKENKVKKLDNSMAAPLVLEQTINPVDKAMAINMLETLDLLLREVPVFTLHCNMEKDAATTAYNEIERLIKDEN